MQTGVFIEKKNRKNCGSEKNKTIIISHLYKAKEQDDELS